VWEQAVVVGVDDKRAGAGVQRPAPGQARLSHRVQQGQLAQPDQGHQQRVLRQVLCVPDLEGGHRGQECRPKGDARRPGAVRARQTTRHSVVHGDAQHAEQGRQGLQPKSIETEERMPDVQQAVEGAWMHLGRGVEEPGKSLGDDLELGALIAPDLLNACTVKA